MEIAGGILDGVLVMASAKFMRCVNVLNKSYWLIVCAFSLLVRYLLMSSMA